MPNEQLIRLRENDKPKRGLLASVNPFVGTADAADGEEGEKESLSGRLTNLLRSLESLPIKTQSSNKTTTSGVKG